MKTPARQILRIMMQNRAQRSWMNQIEIWFGIINRRLLKRRSYLSVQELEASILRFIAQYNISAHPFNWTYKGVPLTV